MYGTAWVRGQDSMLEKKEETLERKTVMQETVGIYGKASKSIHSESSDLRPPMGLLETGLNSEVVFISTTTKHLKFNFGTASQEVVFIQR